MEERGVWRCVTRRAESDPAGKTNPRGERNSESSSKVMIGLLPAVSSVLRDAYGEKGEETRGRWGEETGERTEEEETQTWFVSTLCVSLKPKSSNPLAKSLAFSWSSFILIQWLLMAYIPAAANIPFVSSMSEE